MKLRGIAVIVLGFVLSAQTEFCLCHHFIDLHQEFKKKSVDADVIVQQVGDCLSVSVKNNGARKSITIDPYEVCNKYYTWFPNKKEQLLFKNDKKLSVFEKLCKKQFEINERQDYLRYHRWTCRSYKEEKKLFDRDKELQKLREDCNKLNKEYYGDCDISNIYLGLGLDYVETLYFDLFIFDGAIKMRCSRESHNSEWKVVVYDTKYDGKLAIETDYLGMYDVKADKLIAHSNNDCLINFGTLFSKNSSLLSYFIENRGDICQLIDSIKIDPNSLYSGWKDDEFKRAMLTGIGSELYKRGVCGFFCTASGRIIGDHVETKGFNKVVLSGNVQVNRLISDSTVRIGADLDDAGYRAENIDHNDAQKVEIRYLSAPCVILNAFKYRYNEQTKKCRALTKVGGVLVSHFIIDELDSDILKNLSSVLYNPDDDSEASEDQKRIRSILAGRDSEEGHEYLVFKTNDENFLEFRKALYYPIVFDYISKAAPECLAGIREKQKGFFENDSICVYDKQSNLTEKVRAVIVDGMPYFYSPAGFMYDSRITYNILMRSIGFGVEFSLSVESLGTSIIRLIKIIKELLDSFGVPLDDMWSYMSVVDIADFWTKQLTRESETLKYRTQQKPELSASEYFELRSKAVEDSKKLSLELLNYKTDNFTLKLKEAKKKFDPESDPSMKLLIDELNRHYSFLNDSEKEELMERRREVLLNAYIENLEEVEGYLEAMGLNLNDVSVFDLSRSKSRFRKKLEDFFKMLVVAENIYRRLQKLLIW